MKERLQAIWEKIKEFCGKLSLAARIILLCILGGVIVLCLVLILSGNEPAYTVLYTDLNNAEIAEAQQILMDSNIIASTTRSGALVVEEKDADRARMQLAAGNFGVGSFEFDYTTGLTATQSDKNRAYYIELQKYIKAAIETYDEVSQAVVTLAMPEQNAFALREDIIEPSAAVILHLRPGRELTPQQVQGIVNLVRDSVPGLSEDNISITGPDGDMRTSLDPTADMASAKLRLMEEINAAATERVLNVVQARYGYGNVRVSVSSLVDTDDRVSESKTYIPFDEENPMRNPVDYTEHTRQKNDEAGGIAEGVVGANDNVQTPQYGEIEGEEAGYASYYTNDIYDYLVSSTVEQIVKNGFAITDMQVSVIVNEAQFPGNERNEVIELVARAAGVPTDSVTVQAMEFHKTEIIEAEPEPVPPDPLWYLVVAGIALLVLVILAVVIVVIIMRRRNAQEEESEELLYDEDGVPLVDLLGEEDDFEPITIIETQEQKLKAQIKDLADSDPEIVAQLIKTWLVSN